MTEAYGRLGRYQCLFQKITPGTEFVIKYAALPNFYSGATVTINIHRDITQKFIRRNINSKSIRPQGINVRLFEIVASGGFAITDNSRSETYRLFPGMETFDTTDELIGKIKYYIENPAARQSIIDSMPRYYYEDSIEQLLEVLRIGINSSGNTSADRPDRQRNERVFDRR